MKKLTVNEMREVVRVAAKHIVSGKDKEAVVKMTAKILMGAGVTSFDFFVLKSFDNSLESRIVDVVYKLICGAEAHAHKEKMRRTAEAGKAHPATAAQRRAQLLNNEQTRIFNEQNMINNNF